MAQAAKGKLNYRCPSCFIRDIDIDMFYEEEKKEYYCLRCGFTGQEEDVLRLNEQIRFRYRCMKLRVADFGEDNEPVKFVPHQGGTQ
jgi:Zn ribbon nucleic-acid-binding protein